MRKAVYILLFLIFSLYFGASRTYAIIDPLSVPNNRIGVHILDTNEVADAAKLVNSSGGDWGYVTIPIRIDDRDAFKWKAFFNACSQYHLIPIIRLAAFVDGDKWINPTPYDLVDFANFLSDMPWPVKNRYIIIFNEPNHGNEWGGYVAPDEYADTLIAARDIFKSRSQDYFLITAGLDMSVPNSNNSMDALSFYRQMTRTHPNWYAAVDGLGFHAYPNPAFTASPYSISRFGITSYEYELTYLQRLGFPHKPIFITETGYLGQSEFYTPAFTQVWTDKDIVAITPFILFAGAGDFQKFSLLDLSRKPTAAYNSIQQLTKIKGSPLLSLPQPEPTIPAPSVPLPVSKEPTFLERLIHLFSPEAPKLSVGQTVIDVDISDTDAKRIQGLSGRPSMSQNKGMLFKFPNPSLQVFWMKEMNFPLDFLWINSGKVVELTKNVPPPSQTNGIPRIIHTSFPSDWVLEVNSGFIDRNNIQVGDSVTLSQ